VPVIGLAFRQGQDLAVVERTRNYLEIPGHIYSIRHEFGVLPLSRFAVFMDAS
jgi:hypothetical protein